MDAPTEWSPDLSEDSQACDTGGPIAGYRSMALLTNALHVSPIVANGPPRRFGWPLLTMKTVASFGALNRHALLLVNRV
jgi:hypothetical protein